MAALQRHAGYGAKADDDDPSMWYRVPKMAMGLGKNSKMIITSTS